MFQRQIIRLAVALAVTGVSAIGVVQAQPKCTTTIGSVMSLTGSLGALGQDIAKGAQLAIADMNAAGGVNGCQLALSLFDDQTSPSVGVDAARKLVDVQHVPAIIGALASGVSAAMLTSVTVGSGVVQISPSSTSPGFTEMAEQGRTKGYWFRTCPSDALQGVAMARLARDAGIGKVAVLYLNNPYGQGLDREFSQAFTRAGGAITQSVVYNPSQPSYRAEVSKALGGQPEALFLIGYPGDGTTIAREWIAAGGPQKFLLPDGLQSQDFVNDVGANYLKEVHGTAAGSVETPSLELFSDEFRERNGELPTQPYIPNAYDAGVLIGLAMAQAGRNDADAVRDGIRKVTDPKGEKIYAGVDSLRRGLQLLAEGRPVQYIGASGPLQFDANGDIDAPMVVWSVVDGKVKATGMVSADQIRQMRSGLD